MSSHSQIDVALRQYVLNHFASTVQETAALDTPFPHVIVREFFPGEVYAELIDSLPATEQYEPFVEKKYSDAAGQSNRKRYKFENAWFDKLSGEQRNFWYTIRSTLGSPELKNAIYGKLSDGLGYRYGCEATQAADKPGFAVPELFRETAGYRIKPHPDTRKKVVTMQIALARDESQAHLGTEFYRRSVNPAAWLRAPKGFDIVKVTPFLPNTAYAFVVLNTVRLKSWHGRSALADNWGVRDSILNIWYEKAEDGNKDLIAENESRAALGKAA